jgi:hypothetical protein
MDNGSMLAALFFGPLAVLALAGIVFALIFVPVLINFVVKQVVATVIEVRSRANPPSADPHRTDLIGSTATADSTASSPANT